MAKKEVKTVVHTEAYATKDTFWNVERVKRGLTYNQISEHVGRPIGTVCGWFIGKTRPNRDTVSDLCDYFNSIQYIDGSFCHISYECGMEAFKNAYEKYNAAGGKTVVCRSDKKETKEVIKSMDTSIENRNVNSIHFLLRQRHITYKQLASELKCTVTMIRHWIRGYDMPNDVYIEKMADILEYDPDKLTDLFRREYDKQCNIEGQCTIEDAIKDDILVPSNKDTASDTDVAVFAEPEVKFSPEVEDALKKMADHHDDHERFIKWFNLFASISPVRITEEEIVNIMSQYVCCDYNMFMALEAWHNECKTNYVHERYILLTCERNKWFGEDYER